MRTAERHIFGGHEIICEGCYHRIYSWNSCGDTNCPQCQNIKKQLWIDKMVHHLLPIPHFHIIFTIPQELRDWFYYNQRVFYNLLFRVSWQTISKIAKDKGGDTAMTGMVCTLHTWGSNLSYHPHVHCIVPAGYFAGGTWYRNSKNQSRFYCPSKELRSTYKELFLKYLIEAVEYGEEKRDEINWKGEGIESNEDLFSQLQKDVVKAIRKEWTVRIENPVLGVEQIIEYLARYVKRVAITNSRIEELSEKGVKINYKKYAQQEKGKAAPEGILEFEGAKFIQRFAQHIPPSGFHKVRYYGCYSFSSKKLKGQIYKSIKNHRAPAYQKPSSRSILKKLLGVDPEVCQECGVVGMHVTKLLSSQKSQGYHLTRAYKIKSIRAGPKEESLKF